MRKLEKLDRRTILGVIRMKTNGSSMRECQRRYNIGSSTCQLILKRYKESNLSLIDLESMEPQKLMDVFYPPETIRRKDIPLPDFQTVYDRLME